MNRRSFFGRAVAGAAVVAVAPQVLANIPAISLPRLTSGIINWELIDKLGLLYHLAPDMGHDPVRREMGCSELLHSIRTYLTARGYPNELVDSSRGLAITRKLKRNYNYESAVDNGNDARRDEWRDTVKDASEELIALWDTIAVDGKLLLYRAIFTPLYYDPENFEAHRGILVRYIAPMKLL